MVSYLPLHNRFSDLPLEKQKEQMITILTVINFKDIYFLI